MTTPAEALRSRLPETYQQVVSPSAELKRRKLVASATVPMPPAVLLPSLVVLSQDPDATVRAAAEASIASQPTALLETMIQASSDEVFLGLLLGVVHKRRLTRALTALLVNKATPDEAVSSVARSCDASVAELIGGNQVRLIRCPDIIKSLYFNERTPMATVTRIIETAVRNDVDLSHLPGAERIKQSILGSATELEAEEREPEGAEQEEHEVEGEAAAAASSPLDGASVDDAEFLRLLAEAAQEEGLEEGLFEGAELEPEEEERKSIWAMVRDMSIAQKVRLALVGNMTARAVLIRDAKKLVAQAVLDSPRITEKEILDFSKNKSLADDVIRRIAYNRDWAKNAMIQRALVGHPKCPPQKALEFVKSLPIRDLKELQRDRDIPVLIQRQAKNLLTQREKRKGG